MLSALPSHIIVSFALCFGPLATSSYRITLFGCSIRAHKTHNRRRCREKCYCFSLFSIIFSSAIPAFHVRCIIAMFKRDKNAFEVESESFTFTSAPKNHNHLPGRLQMLSYFVFFSFRYFASFFCSHGSLFFSSASATGGKTVSSHADCPVFRLSLQLGCIPCGLILARLIAVPKLQTHNLAKCKINCQIIHRRRKLYAAYIIKLMACTMHSGSLPISLYQIIISFHYALRWKMIVQVFVNALP